ncbi:MAG: hypothetical protein IJ445_00825 [Clostridia bacterium]|nr:hypothetical protein [Clostridia bacterium]
MKKFMLVLMAILMVASMPVAAFAAHCSTGDCPDWNHEQLGFLYHPCYAGADDAVVDMVGDGTNPVITFFPTVWNEESEVVDLNDNFDLSYLIDGDPATGTYLPAAKTTRLRFNFGHPQEFSAIKVVVNGHGTLNPGAESKGEVFKDTNFDFTVKVVVKDQLGGNVLYESEAKSAKDVKELVFDVVVPEGANAQGQTFDVIITDAATSTTIPRLWDIVVMEKNASYAGAFDESEYVHDFNKEVIDQKPTTVTPGQAHKECTRCGLVDEVTGTYDIPVLTLGDLENNGVVGADDVTITEDILIYDEDGKEIVDIDGNKLEAPVYEGSSKDALFDGDYTTFWSAGNDANLTIEFKKPITVYTFNAVMDLAADSEVKFEFYNGETAVAEDALAGKEITKIVITMVDVAEGDKIYELEITTHEHKFEADPTVVGVNGGEEDPCKWTYTDTCVECEYVQTGIVKYVHDNETTVVKEPTCGDGISSDKCKVCGYESGEYAVAGTGEHDFVTTVSQSKLANCGAEGVAEFVCPTCEAKETASVEALVGKVLAGDLVGCYGTVAAAGTELTEEIVIMAVNTGAMKFPVKAVDVKSGAEVTVNYTLAVDFETGDVIVKSVGAAPAGYHKVGWKTVVEPTYTTRGLEVAYCTVCGEEFKDTNKDLATVQPWKVRVPGEGIKPIITFDGFSKRVADFDGIRATFTVDRHAIKTITDQGYNVNIWIVVTNEAGETKQIQVSGAGAKNWADIEGKTAVVVKGVDAGEVVKFQINLKIWNAAGTQVYFQEVGTTSFNDIK